MFESFTNQDEEEKLLLQVMSGDAADRLDKS